ARVAANSGDALAGASAAVALGLARMRSFDLSGAADAFWATRNYARQLDSASVRAWGPVRLAMVQAMRGDFGAAREAVAEGEAESRRARDWGQLAAVLGTPATMATLEGRYDEADRAGAEAVLCLNRSGFKPVSSLIFSALA